MTEYQRKIWKTCEEAYDHLPEEKRQGVSKADLQALVESLFEFPDHGDRMQGGRIWKKLKG